MIVNERTKPSGRHRKPEPPPLRRRVAGAAKRALSNSLVMAGLVGGVVGMVSSTATAIAVANWMV